MNVLDRMIGFVSPTWGLQRAIARRALNRGYAGAEPSRLAGGPRPKNQAADTESLGQSGADSVRAWARKFVRDNAIATGIVETIATAVVGCGINAQSMVEDAEGNDIEAVNDSRDGVWNAWCEVCDINGEMTFAEIQFLAMREIVEAGECLIRLVPVKGGDINRPVPLALELIEADRIATDHDTFMVRSKMGATQNRVIRGVELTETGRPVAYWIYPEHPNSPYVNRNTTPVRVPASEIIHLYRKDRIGQTRGVSWFAPVITPVRDLGIYKENELQGSAVASCFTAAIKSNGSIGGLAAADGEETTDDNGNTFEYLEPGLVVRLNKDEDIVPINPGRPNSSAEPWINMITREIGVGVGLGYEKVSRDFSKTSYSSARTSELEDRRRFKRYQKYLIAHLCQKVWDRFCEAAAIAGVEGFPTLSELLADRRLLTPVTWQVPEWEWVDPQNDQAASEAAIKANMSTLQRECGKNGINWRENLRQRAKEKKAEKDYAVQPNDDALADAEVAATTGGTGEFMKAGLRNTSNANKGMLNVLNQFKVGGLSETQARVQLSGLGYSPQNIDMLIADMADGVLDEVPA
jgi:lambda family phage portal protein